MFLPIPKKSRMSTLIWVCVISSAMWTFENLLGHFFFSCKTPQRLASFRDENSTVVAYSCSPFLSVCPSHHITPHYSVLECWTCSWKLLMRTESWEAAANVFDVLQLVHNSSLLHRAHGRQVRRWRRQERLRKLGAYQSDGTILRYLLLRSLKIIVSKRRLKEPFEGKMLPFECLLVKYKEPF